MMFYVYKFVFLLKFYFELVGQWYCLIDVVKSYLADFDNDQNQKYLQVIMAMEFTKILKIGELISKS